MVCNALFTWPRHCSRSAGGLPLGWSGRTGIDSIGQAMRLMLKMVASDVMPRTTFELDPSVLAQLRRRAAQEGKSMGQIASELLAQQLAAEAPISGARELQWTSRDLGIPRADLEDEDALYALLDRGP